MSMFLSLAVLSLGAVHVKTAHPATVRCADIFWFVAEDDDSTHAEIHGQDGSPSDCQVSCQVDPHCAYWTYMESLPWDEEVAPFSEENHRGCILIPDTAVNVTQVDILPEDHVYVESGPRYCDEDIEAWENSEHADHIGSALEELLEKRDRHDHVRRRLARKQKPNKFCWGRRCRTRPTRRPTAAHPVKKPTPHSVAHPVSHPVALPGSHTKPTAHPVPHPGSHPVSHPVAHPGSHPAPAPVGNALFYILKVESPAKGLRHVRKDKLVGPWLEANKFSLKIHGGELSPQDISDISWKTLKEAYGFSTDVDFQNAALLYKKKQYGPGTPNENLNQKVNQLEASAEKAEAFRKEAAELTNLGDAEFDSRMSDLKSKYGYKQSAFDVPGVGHAERREAAIGSLTAYSERLHSSLGQAKATLALNPDPQEVVLKMTKNSFVKGVTIDEISPVYYKRATNSFINEYFSEEMRKSVHHNFHSEKSVNAAAISVKGGGLLSWGPTGGSFKASGKFQWESQVDTEQVRDSKMRTCSVSKFLVEQIYNFKIEKVTLDPEVLVDALELGQTINSPDRVVSQWANARAEDFLDKWPLSIFLGPFGVGGYYQVSATTTSVSSVHSTKLISLAQSKAQLAFSMGVSLMSGFGYLNAGASGERQKDVQNVNRFSNTIDNVSVSTHIESHTRGPPVTNAADMDQMLSTMPDTWVTFPQVDDDQYDWVELRDMIHDVAMKPETDAITRNHYFAALSKLNMVQRGRDNLMRNCMSYKSGCDLAGVMAASRKDPPRFGAEHAYEG